MSDSIFTYAILADVFIIGMAVMGLAWSLTKRSVFQKEKEILDKANKEARGILEKANEESLVMVHEARAKISALETKISVDETNFQQLLKGQQDLIIKGVAGHLQRITTSVLSNYQETLAKAVEADLSVFRQSTAELEKAANDEVQAFKNTLQKETVDTQRDVAQKIQETYTKAQEEIKKYRDERIGEIDQHVGEVIITVCKRVTGKVLPLEDHQDLVISSLQKAKREEFF
ncbi:MAG: hypothetical protein UW73_C0012G0023 [Microgenomates group bacterium GW2011_GWB1_44_8]|nr:MAG: hypothetical protein UW73_C0012G0023 [Microgenomates group bacterium GW2011_GWB1_44_8]